MEPHALAPGDHESLDRLNGDWQIFQLKRGHRFSTDDIATAWRASRASPTATRLLDMGCGLGSVGLTTLWRLQDPSATMVGIEAQAESAALARKTVRYNGLEARVRIVEGDLRDPNVLPEGSTFDLVTGSPPYVPLGKGLLSPVPQRAACRSELRGSVYDYCEAARRWLAPGGRFAFVMVAADPRTEDAPAKHGFVVLERWEYVFRPGQPPLIATLVCARAEDGPFPERRTGTLVIRGPDGEWTEDYLRFRAELGADLPSRPA